MPIVATVGVEFVTGTGTSATIPVVMDADQTAQTIVVVVMTRDVTVTHDSVFYGPDEFTKRQTQVGSGSVITIWDKIGDITAGTEDVIVTFSGSTLYYVDAYVVSNALSYLGGAVATGTGTAVSLTNAVTAGNAMIGAVVVGDGTPTTITPDADQTNVKAATAGELATDLCIKQSRSGSDMAWTLGASQAYAAALVEYNQLPTYGVVAASASPTSNIDATMTPGFVERITVNISDTEDYFVEVIS